MKKLIALILVLCLSVGLVACGGKKADDTTKNPTGNAAGPNVNPSTPENPGEGLGPDTVKPGEMFKGKTLQIYGLGTGDDYTDYKQFGKGNYLWMMRAAVEEWATMNGVTIQYLGRYDQNNVLSAMTSGVNPDIIFQTGNFPAMSNVGISSPLSEAEVKMLADICGTDSYFTMMNYKGQSHGFVFPWSGVSMLYYNKTMFEDYGVKTPKEYFLEGNWNYETFQKCLEETTKDLDSDGITDTYGIPADSCGKALCYTAKEDEKGNLISRIDDPIVYDYYKMIYEQVAIKKTIQSPGKNAIQKNVIYPMTAMQIGDCEPYNFEHLYQTIPNGNVLEAIPVPVYVDPNGNKEMNVVWTDSCGSIAATCDERAAALDMISYLLKVGLKYISDYSLGAVPCEYAGMQGTCDLSAQWKTAFAKVCRDRAAAIQKIDGYDAEMVKKINDHINACTANTHRKYANVTDLTSFSEIKTLPPESAIPVVKNKYQAALDTYNDKFIK